MPTGVKDSADAKPPAGDNGEPEPCANGFEPGASREPEERVNVEQAFAESFAFSGIAIDPSLPAIAKASFAFFGGMILPDARKDDTGNDDEQPCEGVDDCD